MSNMNDDDNTDSVDIPTEQKWDGQKLKMVRWMLEMEKLLKRHRMFHTLITRGYVNLRTGKTAVDSSSAILAMHDGTAARLAKRASLATPYPTGKYIASVARELASTDVLASPSKYGTGRVTAAPEPTDDVVQRIKSQDKDLSNRTFVAPDVIEEIDHELGQWILARIDHAGEYEALEELGGGRAMLAHLAERASELSTRQEIAVKDQITKHVAAGMLGGQLTDKALSEFYKELKTLVAMLPPDTRPKDGQIATYIVQATIRTVGKDLADVVSLAVKSYGWPDDPN